MHKLTPFDGQGLCAQTDSISVHDLMGINRIRIKTKAYGSKRNRTCQPL